MKLRHILSLVIFIPIFFFVLLIITIHYLVGPTVPLLSPYEFFDIIVILFLILIVSLIKIINKKATA